MAQISLAWLMTKDPVAAPIVGTTSLDHLTDMIGEFTPLLWSSIVLISFIGSVHVKLTEEEIKYLEEGYTARAIIGHE